MIDEKAAVMAAYEEGYEAFVAGNLLRDCPYPEDSEGAVEWEAGWMAAEEDAA